jgi:hypothetical protein
LADTSRPKGYLLELSSPPYKKINKLQITLERVSSSGKKISKTKVKNIAIKNKN